MRHVKADEQSQPPAGVDMTAVREQLRRVLSSDAFVSSHRLCRFLRFVVERTIENDAGRLKEFVLATEVFDRDESYDPNIDSIVRVEARRLRTKLKTYYDGAGRLDPIVIVLRPGSYAPTFRANSPQEEPKPAQSAIAEYTTVAVLPFVNMSPELEQDFFCDGITEEILNALASVENIGVVARTSSFQFKGKAADVREVGAKLGARVVVEGSVRKSGDKVRITAQAIDATKGYHLWSETYQRDASDVFAIQEEVSRAIAETVRAKLPAQALRRAVASRATPEARAAFLKGILAIHQQNLPGLYASIEQFRELIRSYPEYADPYSGIATAYAALSLASVVSGRDVSMELRRNAEQAVHLNPESADAWTVMGGISAHWDFDWTEAERRFQLAIALQPSNVAAHSWYAMALTILGRFDEAEAKLGVAMRLNPLGASGHARLGFLSYLQGEDGRAISQSEEALKLETGFPDARLTLAFANIRRGDYAAAVDVLSVSTNGAPAAMLMGASAAAYARWGKPDR